MSNFGKDDKSHQNKLVDADLIAGKMVSSNGETAVAVGFRGTREALIDGINKLGKNEYAHLILLTPDDARKYAEYIIQLADQMSDPEDDDDNGETDDDDTFVAG